jgi:hypothetical protein
MPGGQTQRLSRTSQGDIMTIIPWPKNVQRKGALTIAAAEDFKGGHWTTALDKAIATFNQLMSDKGIAVTISKAEKEINAHIRFVTEKGNGIHGNGALSTMKMGGREYLDSITIKVPATPRIGKTAGDDLVQPLDGSEPMPPIRLGATTIANLKKAWPGPE